jgi:hypothetical protein
MLIREHKSIEREMSQMWNFSGHCAAFSSKY